MRRRHRQFELQVVIVLLSACFVALTSVVAVQADYAKRLSAGLPALTPPQASIAAAD